MPSIPGVDLSASLHLFELTFGSSQSNTSTFNGPLVSFVRAVLAAKGWAA